MQCSLVLIARGIGDDWFPRTGQDNTGFDPETLGRQVTARRGGEPGHGYACSLAVSRSLAMPRSLHGLDLIQTHDQRLHTTYLFYVLVHVLLLYILYT